VAKWQRYSMRFLDGRPLCSPSPNEEREAEDGYFSAGRSTSATEIDRIYPVSRRGLFWVRLTIKGRARRTTAARRGRNRLKLKQPEVTDDPA